MSDALTILRALARIWDELPQLFGGDWPRASRELTAALVRLDPIASPTDHDLDDVLAILASAPRAHERFIAALAEALPASVVRGEAPATSTARPRLYRRIPIIFATDRLATGETEPASWFGAGRGDLQFGVAKVSIPASHTPGELESPKWWRLEFRERPEKHVVLESIEVVSRAEVLARLTTQFRAQAETREAILFIHGFNVPFLDAARRTAQIAHDLRFGGLPILYSWPSEGRVPSYMIDAGNARWTAPHFRDLAVCVLQEMGLGTVHVIAHSMGNVVLTEFLRELQARPLSRTAARLRQIIFAAPDIDADTFKQIAAEFHGCAERCTLYVSSNDKALLASKFLQKYPRAGDASDGLVVLPGLDTIDASHVDTSFLGHSYIADSVSILGDVGVLLRTGRAPDEREQLAPNESPFGRYWIIGAPSPSG